MEEDDERSKASESIVEINTPTPKTENQNGNQ